MRLLPPTLPHLFLCAFTLAAGGAVALGLRSWSAAALLAAPLMAAFVEVRLPRPLSTGVTWIARVGILGSVLGGLVQTLYPVIPEAVILGASRALAPVLMLLASVLLLGRNSPGEGVVPAILGALIAAFLPVSPSGLPGAAGLVLAFLVGFLATNDDDRGVRVSPRPLSLAVFVALSASIAAAIIVLLPWAQPRVEVALARIISNDLDASSGLSTESRLGDVEKLALSKRLALRLYGDRPADLRVRTFTSFDGRAWKADPRPARRLTARDVPAGRWPGFDQTPGTALGEPAVALGSAVQSSRLVVPSPQQGAMPAPANTVAVKVEGVNVVQSLSGILTPGEKAALYAVLYSDGNAAESPPGPEMLDVPGSLDPRLRELAATLAGSGHSADEILDRVTGYFQSGYRYTLDVGPFRTKDPVAEFVFEKKKGYCEYFATATTLLLRLSGVSARYVTGFAVRPFQRSGTHYVVRDADAHAWAEAYVPGRGWVEVDATPAADYEALHRGVDSGGLVARLQAIFDELRARFAQGGASGLLLGLARDALSHQIALGAAAVAFLAFRFRRRFRRRAPASGKSAATPVAHGLSQEMRGLLHDIDAFCLVRGAPRPPFRAPREHLADRGVPLDEDERATCLRAVSLLYEQAYGGRPPNPREFADLAAGVAALRARGAGSSGMVRPIA
jgi:hypothetical protein